ncbi:MAG: hypothetical protein QOG53_1757 [Frankiales bacterium]|jgi:hypothetical protein|nr:hypothetical protein [Frankiales bacterium]
MSRLLDRIRIAGAVLIGVVVIAGCGTESGGTNSTTGTANAAIVAAAPDATARAGSTRMSLSLTVKAGSQTAPITGSGAYDYKKRLGELNLVLPAQFGGTMHEIITGNVLYLRLAQLSPKYYVIDINKLTGGSATISQLGNADPSSALETLRGVTSDVSKVGTETIRGASTTHYRGTIDMAKAASKAPAAVRQRLTQQLKTVKSAPFDAFIDDAGRLRKMTTHIVLDSTTTVDTSVELFDFGAPVRITVPPKSQTTDGAALLRLLSGGAQ